MSTYMLIYTYEYIQISIMIIKGFDETPYVTLEDGRKMNMDVGNKNGSMTFALR
jgi:hypothetical protein